MVWHDTKIRIFRPLDNYVFHTPSKVIQPLYLFIRTTVIICPIAIAYIMGQTMKSFFASVRVCVSVRM